MLVAAQVYAAGDAAKSPGSTTPLVQSEDVRERARAAFERGVELSRSGRYAEARDSFWAAFALRPHALASFQAALASRALGDLPSALQALDLTLARPREELSAAEHEAIGRERQEVARLLTIDPAVAASPVPPKAAPASRFAELSCALPDVQVRADAKLLFSTRADVTVYRFELPEGATALELVKPGYAPQTLDTRDGSLECSLKALQPPATRPKPTADGRPVTDAPKAAGWDGSTRQTSYWLAGVGVALAGVGLGLWLYDNQRYEEWQAGRGDPSSDRDKLRDSILFWDKVALVTGATGAGLLLAGGIVYWSSSENANANSGATLAVGPASVRATYCW